MKRVSSVAAMAAAMSVWAVSPAFGQAVVLKFATTNAPNAHLNKQILTPWAERINAEGKGIVQIEVSHGSTLADHSNFYSRVLNNVVQISFGLQSTIAGKFLLTEVVTLPFLSQSAEQSSLALWRLYDSGKLAKEYREIEPLGLVVFPQLSIHARKPVKSLEQVKGLKIRAGGNVASQVARSLGATPVSLTTAEMYQGLAKGTVEAVLVQWTAFQPFKLAEVTTHHIDAPLGASAAMLFMSRKTYDALPKPARDLIARHSGERFSQRFGAFWDRVQAEGRKSVVATGKHVVNVVPVKESPKWAKALNGVTEKWLSDTPDGAVIHQAYRDELARAGARK